MDVPTPLNLREGDDLNPNPRNAASGSPLLIDNEL